MWKKLLPLFVILSVAINLAFIGTWTAHVIHEHGHHGVWVTDRPHNAIWCPLHRQLGTDEQQWKQIKPKLIEFRKAAQEVCRDFGRKRGELIDLVAAPQPDRQAIAAKQEEILAGQRKMQALVIEQLLAEKQMLTSQQQKELFDLLRQRGGCAGHSPMMMNPGCGGGSPCPQSQCGPSSSQEKHGLHP